jgi:uncharacterized iron-regulated membrane protein
MDCGDEFCTKRIFGLELSAGLFCFIVCLTGTLLVFEWDIIRFLERNKLFVSHPGKSVLKVDDLVAKVEQNTNSKVFIVAMHDRRVDTAMSYMMITKTEDAKNTETKHKIHIEWYEFDPYTGEILGKSHGRLTGFFNFVQKIHTSLFLPNPIGEMIVGSATQIFVIIALSGLCLWLPANFQNTKAWKNGFLVRFRKGKNQLIFDLHKTLGFYALIPILLMALTGLEWSFQWYRNGVYKVLNADRHYIAPVKSSLKNPDAKRLPIGFFHEKANELLAPHKGGYRKIFFPEHDDDPIYIMEWRGEEILKLGGLDRILFDQYTGEVLQFDNFDKFPIGKKIVIIFPLIHYGKFLGLTTRIIFFIACLIATTLPITGVMIWWRKLRNLRKAKNKTDDNNLPDVA